MPERHQDDNIDGRNRRGSRPRDLGERLQTIDEMADMRKAVEHTITRDEYHAIHAKGDSHNA